MFSYPNQLYTVNLGLSLFGMDEVLADNMNLLDQAYGAGSSINVNGTLVESPNLNNTTPAAPGGSSNIVFQVDANGNVSAYYSASGGGTVTSVFGRTGVVTAQTGDYSYAQISGTPQLPVTKTAVASNWLRSYDSTTGLFTASQPAYSDISGTPQLPVTIAAVTHQFLISYTSGTGVFTQAQPSASDLSNGVTGTGAVVLASAISGLGSGTVTTFSAGALSPLFTTSVATATTTPALSFSLSNAAQNTFLAGPSVGGPGAPTYRSIVAADVPTLNQNTTGTAANLSGTPALPNGTTATTQTVGDNSTKLATDAFVLGQGFVTASTAPVTSVFTRTGAVTAQAGDYTAAQVGAIATSLMTTLGDIIYENATPAPARLAGNTTSTKMYLSQTGSGTISAAPVWAQINYADITGTTPTPPSGSVLWSALGNAGANLTLSNAAFTTTFNQTSAAVWEWVNTTVATSGTSNQSPVFELIANAWNGSSSVADTWNFGTTIAAGTSGISTLTFGHTGVSSSTQISLPTNNSATVPQITFGGINTGLGNSTTSLNLISSAATCQMNFCNTSGIFFSVAKTSGSFVQLEVSGANQVFLLGNISTAVTTPSVVFGQNGNNFTGTGAGTQVAVSIGATNGPVTFAPTSGATNFTAFQVNPTINQTSTSSGNYTGLLVNVVETSLKGTTNKLLDLQAGTTGGTSKLTVSNSGIATLYGGQTTTKNGLAPVLFTSIKTAQVAAQSGTSLVASTAAVGMWRISFVATITTAASAAGVLGGATGFTITYTNANGDTVSKSTALSVPLGIGASNSTSDSASGDLYCYAGAATAITYSYGYTAGTGTAMQYDIAVYAQYLG